MEEIKEYVQLTLDDYMKCKDDLRRELNNLANGFIRTGYYLKKIRDAEDYRNDGYESIYEFAEKEYGITRTVASRFMSINDKFSENGYSLELMEQYKGLGFSRLTEMLTLDVADHEMVTNVTRIEDIRELKRFEKQEPEGEPTKYEELFRNFFEGKEKELDAVMKLEDVRDIAEIVNPSGNRIWKYRMLFMAMKEHDKGISIKDLLKTVPETITWESFVEQCRKIFTYDPAAAGTPYEQNYGKKPERLDSSQSDEDSDTPVENEKTEKNVTKSKSEAEKTVKTGLDKEKKKDSATTNSMYENEKNHNLHESKADLDKAEKNSTKEDTVSNEPEVCTGHVEEESPVSTLEKKVCDIAQNLENPQCGSDSTWCKESENEDEEFHFIQNVKVLNTQYDEILSGIRRHFITKIEFRKGTKIKLTTPEAKREINARITVVDVIRGTAYNVCGFEVIDDEE